MILLDATKNNLTISAKGGLPLYIGREGENNKSGVSIFGVAGSLSAASNNVYMVSGTGTGSGTIYFTVDDLDAFNAVYNGGYCYLTITPGPGRSCWRLRDDWLYK